MRARSFIYFVSCLASLLAWSGCSDATESPECGNGTLDSTLGEACDDGNQEDGDGCSADCTSDESCGNGITDPGEGCDDGNDVSGDGCQPTCAAASCGDGYVDVGELCDQGALSGTGEGSCLDTCVGYQTCGNGAAEGDEVCDDGMANGTGEGLCLVGCQGVQTCGDGAAEGSEACDEGAGSQVLGECGSTCTVNACGSDCYGATGCPTPEGRCVRFTCTSQDLSQNACASCFGATWASVSHDEWLNQGFCADIGGTYFSAYGASTQCGSGVPDKQCCTSHAGGCAGSDNAWHFYDAAAASNYFTGPYLGMVGSACNYWDAPAATGTYPRLTPCVRVF